MSNGNVYDRLTNLPSPTHLLNEKILRSEIFFSLFFLWLHKMTWCSRETFRRHKSQQTAWLHLQQKAKKLLHFCDYLDVSQGISYTIQLSIHSQSIKFLKDALLCFMSVAYIRIKFPLKFVFLSMKWWHAGCWYSPANIYFVNSPVCRCRVSFLCDWEKHSRYVNEY